MGIDGTAVTALIALYKVPILSLLVGLVLFALAPRLVGQAEEAEQAGVQALILRVMLGAFMALQLADMLLHRSLQDSYDRLLLKASATIAVVYASLLIFNFLARLMESKFGRTRVIDGKPVAVASYHSRMASLILVVILGLFGLFALVKIWDMGSLIERTGFIGVIAAFVVLTNSVWFPDLYRGLTLLGSSMADEGDTVQIGGLAPLYIIHRLTPFYALLLNVDSNERVILRNSRLCNGPIENLNRRASVEGLRRRVDLKIGYPPGEADAQARQRLFADLDKAVAASAAALAERTDLHVNAKVPVTWLLTEAGDNALHVSVFYHLDPLPETKLTRVVRDHLRRTPAAVTQEIYQQCAQRGLHLATPGLVRLSGLAEPPAQRQGGER